MLKETMKNTQLSSTELAKMFDEFGNGKFHPILGTEKNPRKTTFLDVLLLENL